MNKNAVYPGSFDPFTNGHLCIIKKASILFDKITILIGINAKKHREYNADDMKVAIESTLLEEDVINAEVVIYNGLTAEYAQENNINFIVRGLRNTTDYIYEEQTALINVMLNPHLEYVYFRTDDERISSTSVKELFSYGKDISAFVPRSVLNLMKAKKAGYTMGISEDKMKI